MDAECRCVARRDTGVSTAPRKQGYRPLLIFEIIGALCPCHSHLAAALISSVAGVSCVLGITARMCAVTTYRLQKILFDTRDRAASHAPDAVACTYLSLLVLTIIAMWSRLSHKQSRGSASRRLRHCADLKNGRNSPRLSAAQREAAAPMVRVAVAQRGVYSSSVSATRGRDAHRGTASNQPPTPALSNTLTSPIKCDGFWIGRKSASGALLLGAAPHGRCRSFRFSTDRECRELIVSMYETTETAD